MEVARYWRVTGIDTWGLGPLALSTLGLYTEAGRVDTAGTLTCSHAPASGSLANLQDGDLTTHATWSRSDYMSRTFALTWDIGTAQAVTAFSFGGAGSRDSFPYSMRFSSSPDGLVWTVEHFASPLAFPGVNTSVIAAPPSLGTWNPLDKTSTTVLSNSDRTATIVDNNRSVRGVTGKSSGKHQFEFVSSLATGITGVATADMSLMGYPVGAGGRGIYSYNGNKYGVTGGLAYSVAYTNQRMGVVIDFTSNQLTFYKNGVSLGVAFTDIAGATWFPASGSAPGGGDVTLYATAALIAYPVAGASPWVIPSVHPSFVLDAKHANTLKYPHAYSFAAAEPGTHTTPMLALGGSALDMEYGGVGIIAGTVKEKNVPANTPLRRRVLLVEERSRITVSV